MSWTDDAMLLDDDPRASVALIRRACGGGLRQPNGTECHESAAWIVLRASGRPYQHRYCTVHAARLRAIDRLRLAAELAAAKRAAGVRCG